MCIRDSPNGACEVQEQIGAVNAAGFDISAACTGFVYALNTAHAYIKSGIYRTVLVIGSDVLSKLIDWTDRGTCVLFGDGAGAAVVRAADRGVIGVKMCSDEMCIRDRPNAFPTTRVSTIL